MSLEFLSSSKEQLLVLHGKTQADLDADVEMLREWLKKQPHLPKTLIEETNFLEISLIKNKYSLEKAKAKLENYCTLKRKYSFIFEDYLGKIKPTTEMQFFHTIEMLTDDKLQRIIITQIRDEDTYDMPRDIAVEFFYREFCSRFDYNNGEILIADYSVCSMYFVTKITRIDLILNATALTMKGFSARIKEIHLVNKWASKVHSFSKIFLPEKLFNRVHLHSDYTTLKNFIEPKYLPKNYGGEYKSLEEIREDWETIFTENLDLLTAACNTMTNEELRVKSSDEMQGSFRKLVVD